MPLHVDLDYALKTPIFRARGGGGELKQCKGAKYHARSKSWIFPAFYPVHQEVASDIRTVCPDAVFSERALAHLIAQDDYAGIPDDYEFITQPYAHQLEGLEFVHRNLRAGLFFNPGLGKSKVVVDLQRLVSARMLIICPLVMLDSWRREFEVHGNSTNTLVLDGTKKRREKRRAMATEHTYDAVITTFGTATQDADALLQVPYDTIVIDESHNFKTPFSKRTKAGLKLSQRAHRRVILSGTPSLGSPADLYAQLRFLGTFFCPEPWWPFRRKFFVFPQHELDAGVPKMVLGYKNLELMNNRVNSVCIRRTKDECLDLPERQVIDVEFSLTPGQRKFYNKLVVEGGDDAGQAVRVMVEDQSLNTSDGPTLPPYVLCDQPITLVQKLGQVASGFVHTTTQNPGVCNGCEFVQDCVKEEIRPFTRHCKKGYEAHTPGIERQKTNARLQACDGLLDSILVEKENHVIIWANLHAELDDIESSLIKRGVGYVRVQGGMTREGLTTAMDTFNNDANCRVYLAQVGTGIGITLNAANYTIYYTLPFSLDYYLQSIDRNHRIGQQRGVTVYRLLAKGSLDPSKAVALDNKLDISDLLTQRAPCLTCDRLSQCTATETNLYDDACRFDRSMPKTRINLDIIS